MRKLDRQCETFNKWFASYLGESELEVARLLQDATAVQFLITWSLLESKCFSGFLRKGDIARNARELTADGKLEVACLRLVGAHFHGRYQDKKLYNNLMHKERCTDLEEIFIKQFATLSTYELVYMVIYVVYRYRNNIFHGNKGVESWLHYRQQIRFCIDAMQVFITHNKYQEMMK
jgi:hypothetical protein